MTIKAVVADDEPLARERVKRLMSVDPDLEIVCECRNGMEVVETLRAQQVDLLLLDIQMPGLNGFDVVREMGSQALPMVVFVTAHDSYAIQAFDVHAVDYLLKPIEAARFQDAMNRVKERSERKSAMVTHEKLASVMTTLAALAEAPQSAYPARFLVHSGAKDIFVNVKDIDWIEAADYYVCLHTSGKSHMLRESIKKLEGELDPAKFIRVHRSAIVNIESVSEIHREGRAEGWVLLSSGARVRMSTVGWQRLLKASRV